jgi:thiol-disulfide isomerase/thioredoxin
MKIKSTILLFAIVQLFSLRASAQTNRPTAISGKINHGGQQLLMLSSDTYIPNSKKTMTDSVKLEGGEFSFNTKALPAGLYSVFLKGNDRFIVVFLDGSPINLTGDAAALNAAVITGSRELDIRNKFRSALRPLKDREEELFTRLMAMNSAGKADSVKLMKGKLDTLQKKIFRNVDSLIKTYPDSYAALEAYTQYDKQIYNDEAVLSNLDKMPLRYKAMDKYAELKNTIVARNTFVPGNAFKNFELSDINGKTVSTALHKNYLIVDFWASWCVPCRNQTPTLKKLYRAFRTKGLQIISVSVDEKKEAWKKAVADDGMSWTQLISIKGQDPALKAYAINDIPLSYIVDEKGMIVAKNLSGQELEQKIAQLYEGR